MQMTLLKINNSDESNLSVFYKCNNAENLELFSELIGINKEIVFETYFKPKNSKKYIFNGNKYLQINDDTINSNDCNNIIFNSIIEECLSHYNSCKSMNSNLNLFKVNLYNEKNDPFFTKPLYTFIITEMSINSLLTKLFGL
jgi:ubiquitin